MGVILGDIALAVPLIGYAINGSFMRYSGDDYCYGRVLTQLGFWKAQWISYFHAQAYNGNRYSLTLFSDISGWLGPYMSGVLPALAIAIWIVGIFFSLHWAARLAGLSLHRAEKVFIAELLVFFTLYLAPNLPQSLYWRSGMLPYLAPLIINTFLIGVILKLVQNRKTSYYDMGVVILLAFMAGGFSETAASLQLGYLTLILIGCLILQHRRIEWAGRAVKIIGVALISTIAAILVLAVSPANTERLLKSARPDFFSFSQISFHSAIRFIVESISGQPLPVAVLFIFSIGISWVIFSRLDQPLRVNKIKWLYSLLIVSISCFALIVFCTAPSAYAQSAFPELRALITARFVMVTAIIATGSLVGLMVQRLLPISSMKPYMIQLSVLMVLGIMCIYPIYAARNIYRDIPKYQRWSVFWDTRNQEIQKALQNNIMDVSVVKIDHIIPSVGDLSEDPTYWYNICAAGYYRVATISANKPGWDLP